MKATIKGVEVEGTPEEIWALLQRKEGATLKPHQPMPDFTGQWWGIYPPHGSGTGTVPEYLKYPFIISLNVTE